MEMVKSYWETMFQVQKHLQTSDGCAGDADGKFVLVTHFLIFVIKYLLRISWRVYFGLWYERTGEGKEKQGSGGISAVVTGV